jgi:hypothetical protein
VSQRTLVFIEIYLVLLEKNGTGIFQFLPFATRIRTVKLKRTKPKNSF